LGSQQEFVKDRNHSHSKASALSVKLGGCLPTKSSRGYRVYFTGAPEDESFSDGLTEDLTNAVAHLEGLRVVAHTSAFQFKGKARDIRALADQLPVTH
jgi:hypothetical protein